MESGVPFVQSGTLKYTQFLPPVTSTFHVPRTLSQCCNNGQKPRSSSLIRKHRGAFIRGWPPCALWVSIYYFHHVTLMAFVLMRR